MLRRLILVLLRHFSTQKFEQLLDQLVRTLSNRNRRYESHCGEDAANLSEVKPLGGIVGLEVLLLVFHTFKNTIELFQELLVRHRLRLLQSLLLRFLL